MRSALQAQKQTHCEVLEAAIRWEQVRTAWYTRTNEWQQVEDCLAREQHLTADLEQERRDAELIAEHRPC